MNEPLSIIDLVTNASIVVQCVMAILVLASMVSWVMIFQRGFSLSSIKRESIAFEDEFWSGKDLRKIYLEIEASEREPVGMELIFVAGFKEFTRLRQQKEADPRSHYAKRAAGHAGCLVARRGTHGNKFCRFWRQLAQPALTLVCSVRSGAL